MRLVKSLHTNSWLRYGDLDSCIVALTGRRQGCKLGGIICKTVSNETLAMVKQKLREAEVITLVFASVSGTIWHRGEPMFPGSVERVIALLSSPTAPLSTMRLSSC